MPGRGDRGGGAGGEDQQRDADDERDPQAGHPAPARAGLCLQAAPDLRRDRRGRRILDLLTEGTQS